MLIEDFDIHEVISEAVAAFETEVREKGLELTIRAAHQQMHTDRRRLLQAILNLIGNAVKFTERGSVSVQARLIGCGFRNGMTDLDSESAFESAITETHRNLRD